MELFKYASKIYTREQQNEIWRRINTKNDLELMLIGLEHNIDQVKKLGRSELFTLEFHVVEKELANAELAINRVKELLAGYNCDWLRNFIIKFNKLEEELDKFTLAL